MDSRRIIAAQNRARERAQRLEKAGLGREAYASGRHPGVRRPQPGRSNGSPLLPVLTLVLFAFIGGYWHLYGSPFELAMSPRAMASLGHDLLPASDRYVNDKFEMGGVQLGMTPGMVKRLHPTAKVGEGREGERVVTVSTPRGMMVAWLYEDDRFVEVDGDVFFNERERIYRLRLDEVYSDLTEQELMRMYARTYGRPLEANCERNQLGDTPRCTYRWWGGDGIELTVIMKQKLDANAQRYVLLTTIATNTQKGGKQAAVPLSRLLKSARTQG